MSVHFTVVSSTKLVAMLFRSVYYKPLLKHLLVFTKLFIFIYIYVYYTKCDQYKCSARIGHLGISLFPFLKLVFGLSNR